MAHKLFIVIGCLFLFSCSPRYLKKLPPAAQSCPHATLNDSLSISDKLGLPEDRIKNQTGIYSLENGGESFITRNWLFENAQKKLDIQYYMFLRDRTGLICADYIVRAADRGVKVRLLIDDATAKKGSYEIYGLDSHPNIEVKIYNPGIKLGSLNRRIRTLFTKPWRFHRRMHNKTITVDGVLAMTGGRNISDEYFDYDHRYNFRDRDVLLAGKETAAVTTSFEEFWNHELSVPYKTLIKKYRKKFRGPDFFNSLHAYACDEKNLSGEMKEKVKNFPAFFKQAIAKGEFTWVNNVSFVSDNPGKNENRKNHEGGVCKDSLYALLDQAKKSVDIQSSYLIVNDEEKKLLTDLVNRGVKVRVLTNSLESIDNIEAFSGFQRDRDLILSTGIEIYEFKPHAPVRKELMIPEVQAPLNYAPVYGHHAKTMIIDNNITIIGTFNIDPRSSNLNTECIAIIRSPEVSATILTHLNKEFSEENAWHATQNFNPDKKAPLKKKIETALRRIFPKSFL